MTTVPNTRQRTHVGQLRECSGMSLYRYKGSKGQSTCVMMIVKQRRMRAIWHPLRRDPASGLPRHQPNSSVLSVEQTNRKLSISNKLIFQGCSCRNAYSCVIHLKASSSLIMMREKRPNLPSTEIKLGAQRKTCSSRQRPIINK